MCDDTAFGRHAWAVLAAFGAAGLTSIAGCSGIQTTKPSDDDGNHSHPPDCAQPDGTGSAIVYEESIVSDAVAAVHEPAGATD